MIKLFIGFLIGAIFMLLVRFAILWSKDKRGRDYLKYNTLSLNAKLKIIIRKIIVDFSIRSFNRDFLVSIKLRGQPIIQLLHRSHFPHIITDLTDVKFGVAVYIPLRPLTDIQRKCLIKILNEELEQFTAEDYPKDYFVVDAGAKVRYTGYLLTKIIKEVFNAEDVDLELQDGGFLPYHYQFDIPMKQNPN